MTFTPRYDGKAMPRVSSKNQITIPVDVLREAGLRPGDEVSIRAASGGRIELTPTADLVERFAGSVPPGTYPPGAAEALRREWDR